MIGCERCARMAGELEAARADLAQCRSDLGANGPLDRQARWMKRFGCSAGQAAILIAMADAPGRVFTRDAVLDLTQAHDGPDERLDRAVDSRIKHLRKRLNAWAAGRSVILTLYGMGYVMDADAAGALKAEADA